MMSKYIVKYEKIQFHPETSELIECLGSFTSIIEAERESEKLFPNANGEIFCLTCV